MKTDCLQTDLFLEAEEALRGLLAIEHRRRLPISESNITCDHAKLEYLQKLVQRAGLTARCEHHLVKVIVEKMENTTHTRMALDDYAKATLRAVAEELEATAQHGH